MKTLIYTFTSILLFFSSCQGKGQTKNADHTFTTTPLQNLPPIQTKSEDGLNKAYFASGCFWCVEAIYESVSGVEEVVSGYAGGHTENPTYESSNTGKTGHAEAVEVLYDPAKITFEILVDVYFGSQNPTQVNGQGPDNGSQYRSIIFYQNEVEKEIINKKKDELYKKLNKKIAAEVIPFQKFWKAEGYHQNYEKINPQNPYIKNVSIPRLKRFKNKFPDLIKKH